MATIVVNPTTNSGAMACQSTTAANARDGTGTKQLQAANDARIGQYFNTPTYWAFQHADELDLASLAGATITGCVAKRRCWFADVAGSTFIMRYYAIDFGTFAAADFASAASLAAATLLAHGSPGADSADITMTNDGLVAFLAAAAGSTARIIIGSNRQETNVTPTGFEYITSFYDGNTGDGGVAHPPEYTITYTPAASVVGPSFQGGGYY